MKFDKLLIIRILITALILVVGTGLIHGVLYYEPGPDGYYTEHYHSGTIIGMNESRLVFYVETSKSISEVPVGPSDFNHYEIGDQYEWIIVTYHRRTGISNLTMIHSW